MQVQYKVLDMSNFYYPESILNEVGEHGWEVAAVAGGLLYLFRKGFYSLDEYGNTIFLDELGNQFLDE